jgi:hypothetical protein
VLNLALSGSGVFVTAPPTFEGGPSEERVVALSLSIGEETCVAQFSMKIIRLNGAILDKNQKS